MHEIVNRFYVDVHDFLISIIQTNQIRVLFCIGKIDFTSMGILSSQFKFNAYQVELRFLFLFLFSFKTDSSWTLFLLYFYNRARLLLSDMSSRHSDRKLSNPMDTVIQFGEWKSGESFFWVECDIRERTRQLLWEPYMSSRVYLLSMSNLNFLKCKREENTWKFQI